MNFIGLGARSYCLWRFAQSTSCLKGGLWVVSTEEEKAKKLVFSSQRKEHIKLNWCSLKIFLQLEYKMLLQTAFWDWRNRTIRRFFSFSIFIHSGKVQRPESRKNRDGRTGGECPTYHILLPGSAWLCPILAERWVFETSALQIGAKTIPWSHQMQ